MDIVVKNVIVLGAGFNTGNLGVSALAWSAVHMIKIQWPKAQVTLLGGRTVTKDQMNIAGTRTSITTCPVRYCRDLNVENHLWKLWMGVVFSRMTGSRFSSKKNSISNQNTLNILLNADMICDITGGDSFSDIYGMKRFLMGYLLKRICQMTGKPFVMLPQTYGPFKTPVTKFLARRILKKAAVIYSRDKEGIEVVKELIGKIDKLALCADVAFVLEPKGIEQSAISNQQLAELLFKEHKKKVIGLNVSGLLFNGGYTGNNEFALKCDYKHLVKEIIGYFASLPNTIILLVPHVVPENFEVENDLVICQKFRDNLGGDVREKVIIAEPGEGNPFFDQCEIKYIIGKCDFFMGSRMHATIAAISQCIPTVGLAYSKKFAGVYETVGIEDCVVDLRNLDNGQILNSVKSLYERSEEVKKRLEKNIPAVKQKVFQLFDNFSQASHSRSNMRVFF